MTYLSNNKNIIINPNPNPNFKTKFFNNFFK